MVNLKDEREERAATLLKLKMDLAIRENNDSAGSGLGGNAAQFFYILNKRTLVRESPYGAIKITEDDQNLYFELPFKTDLVDLRSKLNEVFEKSPQKNIFSEEQISDVDFLKSLNLQCDNVFLLIRGLQLANQVRESLDYQKDFMDKISLFFKKEFEEITDLYLKEMNLPSDYFSSKPLDFISKLDYEQGTENREVLETMDHHPVWGKKRKAISARQDVMIRNLLGQEDIDKLSILDSLPLPITFFTVRSRLGIERLVTHDLDENENFKFFKNVSKAFSAFNDVE